MTKKYSSEHQAYYDAKRRCTNKNTHNYQNYGGRGIQFKLNSFQEFLDAVGERPVGYLLDRIDNNGHYEVGNLRWVSAQESKINQRLPEKARKNSSSGCLYVSWHSKTQRWFVQVPNKSHGKRQKILCWTTDFFDACCYAKRFVNG